MSPSARRTPRRQSSGGLPSVDTNFVRRRYGDAVVLTTYEGLFAAIGSASAALTGLLFVAISVAPRRGPVTGPVVIQQIRAAAALLCFVNALAVSLYGLVPDGNIGYPALTLGVIGILFTAAAVRSVLSSGSAPRQKLAQIGLFTLLLLIFGTGVVSGIAVIANPGDHGQVQVIGYALVSSLIVGISRAWELIGDRIRACTPHWNCWPVALRMVTASASPDRPTPSTQAPARRRPARARHRAVRKKRDGTLRLGRSATTMAPTDRAIAKASEWAGPTLKAHPDRPIPTGRP